MAPGAGHRRIGVPAHAVEQFALVLEMPVQRHWGDFVILGEPPIGHRVEALRVGQRDGPVHDGNRDSAARGLRIRFSGSPCCQLYSVYHYVYAVYVVK